MSSLEVGNYIPTSCWFEKNQFLSNVLFTKWKKWYTQSCIFLKFFTNFFQKKKHLGLRHRSTFSTSLEVGQLHFNFILKFWKILNLNFEPNFQFWEKKKFCEVFRSWNVVGQLLNFKKLRQIEIFSRSIFLKRIWQHHQQKKIKLLWTSCENIENMFKNTKIRNSFFLVGS